MNPNNVNFEMADETRGLQIDAGRCARGGDGVLLPMDHKATFPKSRPGGFNNKPLLLPKCYTSPCYQDPGEINLMRM
jgi:hypothetical protein